MAELTEEQKTFIVQRLACFDGPQAVASAVKEEYEVEIDRAHVYRYNPLRPGYDLGDRWRELFEATRKAFLDDTSEIGIAHKSVRLKRLDELCRRAIEMRNYALAATLMEQAAKECGDAFSNKHRLIGGGEGDDPIRLISKVERVIVDAQHTNSEGVSAAP